MVLTGWWFARGVSARDTAEAPVFAPGVRLLRQPNHPGLSVWGGGDQSVVDELEGAGGDFFFGAGKRGQHFAVGGEDFDGVVAGGDRGWAVRDDQVAVFALELGQGAETVVFGFESEADDPAGTFTLGEGGDDVFGLDEVEVDGTAGLGDLVGLDARGRWEGRT